MYVGDHLYAWFRVRGYETGLAGERLAQSGQRFAYVLIVNDYFHLMFGDKFLDHPAPLRIAPRRLRDHQGVVRAKGNNTAQQARSAKRELSSNSEKQHTFIPNERGDALEQESGILP